MTIKADDIVLCTVKKIEGTTVFVDIDNNGEGSIVMSEIAAGRIRNLREYVVPNKKIVCKVLRIVNNQIELSLRRVTGKERETLTKKYQKEQTFTTMLNKTIKNPQEIIKKIKSEYDISEFIEKARENPKILDNFVSKEEAKLITKILSEKKEKEKRVKKVITLKSNSESGVDDIKQILSNKEVEIRYLGGSNFTIFTIGKDFKEANQKLDSAILEIEKKAKEKKAILEIKEK